jgi:hypothetical protein
MKNFDREKETLDRNAPIAVAADAEGVAEAGVSGPIAGRPGNVPEKFWDAENGALKSDELLRSYAELERKLGSLSAKRSSGNVLDVALATKGASDAYDIVLKHEALRVSRALDERMHKAGFTNEQAQLVYDIEVELMIPAIESVVREFRLCRDLEKLEEYFGGEERFDEISRQLALWAEKSLPAEVYESLNSSYYGVIALYNMMGAAEPGLVGVAGGAIDALSDAKLKDMMRDPRYWRDGDKDFIRKVDEGFKTLYGCE